MKVDEIARLAVEKNKTLSAPLSLEETKKAEKLYEDVVLKNKNKDFENYIIEKCQKY